MNRRAQSLMEFAMLAVVMVGAAAAIQSALLPSIGGLLDSITDAILSLRV